VVASGERAHERTRTDASGRFRIVLPRGHYTVEATNTGAFRSTDAAEVSVGPSPVRVVLNVASGIR
jgi:hypothetical protein